MTIITLIQAYPIPSIIIIGVLASFFISLIQFFIMDKVRMHEIKGKQKSLQEEMKKHKDNPQKMLEVQKEMMSHTMEMFKHSFKPMLITTIPILILIAFIKNVYSTTTIAKSWIWWYIGAAIISSLIFRKMFKLP